MRLILFDVDFLYHSSGKFNYAKVDYTDSIPIAILTHRNAQFEKDLGKLGIEITVCERHEIPYHLPATLFYYLGIDSTINSVTIYSGADFVKPLLREVRKFVGVADARTTN
jgi:hypothetical protein